MKSARFAAVIGVLAAQLFLAAPAAQAGHCNTSVKCTTERVNCFVDRLEAGGGFGPCVWPE